MSKFLKNVQDLDPDPFFPAWIQDPDLNPHQNEMNPKDLTS